MRIVLRVLIATSLFALLHSASASRMAKDQAARFFGRRARNAFYRPFYLLQSLATATALVFSLRRVPDVVLYKVPRPWSFLFHLGQLAGLAWAVFAAVEVGLPSILGIAGIRAWLSRATVVPAETEAQGPSPDGLGMRDRGPFRWSRHPLNFAPLPIFWLSPVMTAKLLAFNIAATVYLVIGSYHEEKRLLSAYGPAYVKYQRSGTPFYVPMPSARTRSVPTDLLRAGINRD